MGAEYLDWSTFRNRFVLAARLKLDTALRIGAGGADTAVGPEIAIVRDALGHPYIPGSSFKGVLRNVVERFARTVNHKPKLWACDNPLDHQKGACVTDDDKKRHLERATKNGALDEARFTHELADATCTVCRLFGSPWLASKVRVKDLPLDETTWLGRVEVRHGVGIDRDTRTAASGLLYTFESVPSGAEFICEIIVENVTELELGLLLVGLRQMQLGQTALGGARSRGLGWATLSELSASRIAGPEALLTYVTMGTVESLAQEQLDAYIKGLQTALTAGGV